MRWLLLTALVLAACGSGPTGGDDDVTPGAGPYFPSGAFYFRDISGVTPVGNSAAITANMESLHGPNGWGTGEMRIDFALVVNNSPGGVQKRSFSTVGGFYWAPDCDLAPMPLPSGGAVEVDWQTPPTLSGLEGYDCVDFDGGNDCHILIHVPEENRLYELYHGTFRDGTFEGGCQAVWDTSTVPPADGRGQQCSSADAAGYAIAPLLVTPEEVMAGEIRHAVRLILPPDLIRGGVYYPPATHGTDTTGTADTLPYGGRMRLRSDYPIDTLDPAAQVVARAMQRYGLLLADGGNIALTVSSDVLSTVKWDDVGLYPDSLSALRASDFDVIIEGSPITTGVTDCDRVQLQN